MAGGASLNEVLGGGRVSRDLDLFHDSEEAVASAWDSDRHLLEARGYAVRVLRERPSFVEAQVGSGGSSVLIQWTRDSAYRFFPLVEPRRFPSWISKALLHRPPAFRAPGGRCSQRRTRSSQRFHPRRQAHESSERAGSSSPSRRRTFPASSAGRCCSTTVDSTAPFPRPSTGNELGTKAPDPASGQFTGSSSSGSRVGSAASRGRSAVGGSEASIDSSRTHRS